MGLFDSVKKIATSPVGSTVGGFLLGGPIGAGAGYLAGKALRGAGGQEQQDDGYSQARKAYSDALEGQRKKMVDISDKFRKEAPALEERSIASVGDQERRQAGADVQNVRKNASSRGLLYSGLRQGAEAGAVQQAQSRITNRANQISQEINAQKDILDQRAIDAGLNKQGAELGLAKQDFASGLENANERRKALASLLSGVGSVGGSAAGMAMGKKS